MDPKLHTHGHTPAQALIAIPASLIPEDVRSDDISVTVAFLDVDEMK